MPATPCRNLRHSQSESSHYPVCRYIVVEVRIVEHDLPLYTSQKKVVRRRQTVVKVVGEAFAWRVDESRETGWKGYYRSTCRLDG